MISIERLLLFESSVTVNTAKTFFSGIFYYTLPNFDVWFNTVYFILELAHGVWKSFKFSALQRWVGLIHQPVYVHHLDLFRWVKKPTLPSNNRLPLKNSERSFSNSFTSTLLGFRILSCIDKLTLSGHPQTYSLIEQHLLWQLVGFHFSDKRRDSAYNSMMLPTPPWSFDWHKEATYEQKRNLDKWDVREFRNVKE